MASPASAPPSPPPRRRARRAARPGASGSPSPGRRSRSSTGGPWRAGGRCSGRSSPGGASGRRAPTAPRGSACPARSRSTGNRSPRGATESGPSPDSTSWTLVFSRAASAFHLSYPEGRDALRVRAAPQRGEHVETLQFAFPLVDADSAVLQLRWGTTVVPLTLRARPGGTR
ncbi:MAG TPA: DUF2911 domain-containing protein [Longimicrobiaceae bacterium]